MANAGSLTSATSFGRVYRQMKLHVPSLSGAVSELSANIIIQGSYDNTVFDNIQVYNPASATFNNLQIKSLATAGWFDIAPAGGFKYLRVQTPSFNISAVMSFVFYGSNPFSSG